MSIWITSGVLGACATCVARSRSAAAARRRVQWTSHPGLRRGARVPLAIVVQSHSRRLLCLVHALRRKLNDLMSARLLAASTILGRSLSLHGFLLIQAFATQAGWPQGITHPSRTLLL